MNNSQKISNKKIKYMVIILIIMSFIVSIVIYNINDNQNKKNISIQIQEYIDKVKEVFAEYNVYDVDVTFNNFNENDTYIYAYPRVISNGYDNLSPEEKYNLFLAIDKVTSNFNYRKTNYNKNKLVFCFFQSIENDKNRYTFSSKENDETNGELLNHYTEVIYRNPSTKNEKSISSMPYKGMAESILNYTPLGKADEIEKCTDFYLLKPSHRHTTYKWFKKGSSKKATDLICSATISYWDYKNKKEVSGYVQSITYFGDYKSYNK